MPITLLPNQAQTIGATVYLCTHASSQGMRFLVEGESLPLYQVYMYY